MRTGDIDAAERWFRESAHLWELVRGGPARWALSGQALACGLAGREDDLAALLDRLDRTDPRGFEMLEHRVHRARAWRRFLADGTPGTLAEAAPAAAADAMVLAAAEIGRDLVMMGAVEEAAAVFDARRAPGPLTAAWSALAHAITAQDGEQLEQLGDRFEAIGAVLDAAEAWAHAGQAHRRSGSTRSASRCEARARSLAARCPGADLPVLRRRADSAELSTREREVATLAASGLTNRAIAAQLFVSERTVENHLYRTFAKLAVSTRDELGAHLSS
jgi:DNA-binding CsgD family transcriptional regulator